MVLLSAIIKLTAQLLGHSIGCTHLLLVTSMSCPGGQPHPRWHCRVHTSPGLVQVAGQVLHSWNTAPCILHDEPSECQIRHIITM